MTKSQYAMKVESYIDSLTNEDKWIQQGLLLRGLNKLLKGFDYTTALDQVVKMAVAKKGIITRKEVLSILDLCQDKQHNEMRFIANMMKTNFEPCSVLGVYVLKDYESLQRHTFNHYNLKHTPCQQ